MANVPSFRFSFRGNIRRNHPFGNHPFVNTKKGHWEIKGRFPKGRFWRMYPRSGFRSGGTSAETTLLETTLLRTPEFSSRNKTRADPSNSQSLLEFSELLALDVVEACSAESGLASSVVSDLGDCIARPIQTCSASYCRCPK